MMKILYTLSIYIISCITAFSASHPAELFVQASASLEVASKAKGTHASYAAWMNENVKKSITATLSADETNWREIKFSILPSADSTATLTVRSGFLRAADKSILDNSTIVKNLKINGKAVPEFNVEDGVLVTYTKKKTVDFKLKKGEKVELSALVRVPEQGWGSTTIDLSKVANVVASKPDVDMKAIDVKNGTRMVKGVKFSFLDSKGKSVVRPKDKDIFIDVSDKKINQQFMYVVANVGDSVDFTDHACGTIDLSYDNGTSARLWIRNGRDFNASIAPQKNTTRGLYLANADVEKTGGSLFMTQFPIKGNVTKIVITGSVNVFAITFSNDDITTIEPMKFDMAHWRPVDMSNLEIKDGSALDVSEGIGKPKAGRYGKVRIGKSGNFEFEKMPNKPVRFKGTNWRPGDMFGYMVTTHEQIDQLAKMVRKQGYNLVRWRLSMSKNEFDAPYKLNEKRKDLYDYFFYAMAREGVYHHFNLSSHDLGAPDFVWHRDRFNVKILMYFGDPKTRQDWRNLMNYQLNLVNKYTGKKWKDDPSIATTEYFNEIELGPMDLSRASLEVKAFVDQKFVKYLKENYDKFEDLKNADPQTFGKFSKFEDVKACNVSPSQPDYSRFVIEYGRDLQRFCEKVIREEIGFTAPLHQHNCSRAVNFALLSSEAGDYTALNVYHNHPSGFMTKGSFVGNKSSISDFGGYFRAAAAKRVAGRPMMLSEWQHCYWNPYMYEAGVLFPAYSAFQGFDNLTVHDVAIMPPHRAGTMGCFEVFKSPVFRANEFLSYALFYRGDVKKTENRVDMIFDKDYLASSKDIGRAMNSEQSKVALMTGFAIDFPSARKTPIAKNIRNSRAILKMSPEGSSDVWSAANFASTGEGKGEYKISDTEAILREKGVLRKGNITDSANGIFQSDTGEITMRVNEKVVKVVTAKTEAIALTPETKNEKLGKVTVHSTSVPASFAVVSVDNKSIANSQRMVLVYNTDNIMTDFKVAEGREILISAGTLPVLMKVGKLSATLDVPSQKKSILKRVLSIFKKSEEPKSYSLYSLKITGERIEKLPLQIKDGKFAIEIDTTKMKETTPFFELVAE